MALLMKLGSRLTNDMLNNSKPADQIDGTTPAMSVGMTQPTLKPSIPYETHLALTISATAIFGALFLFIYVQLWMVLYYRHKRRSYQTVFLFLCLVWAALRLTLFTFYYNQKTIDLANDLSPFPYWLLYSFPVVLQFTTLVVLVTFFSQVVVKARYPQQATKYKFRIRVVCALSVLVFVTVNIVCGVITRTNLHASESCTVCFRALVVRVAINGFLFLAHGVALSYWIFSLHKVANARAILESRGTNLCQSCTTCIFIVFVFASRTLYNALALILPQIPDFGFGWLNVTDQADLVNLDMGANYVIYLVVLAIWEILPTFIVIIFFRVQKPSRVQDTNFDDVSYRQRYIFDNPRRYDSEEDLSIKYTTRSRGDSGVRRPINIPSTSSAISTSSGVTPVSYDRRLSHSSSTSKAFIDSYDGT